MRSPMSEGEREEGDKDTGAGSRPWSCHPPCPPTYPTSPSVLHRLLNCKMRLTVIALQASRLPSVRSSKPKCQRFGSFESLDDADMKVGLRTTVLGPMHPSPREVSLPPK